MNKVTVKTNTKGKGSQPFEYVAVGRFVTKEVKDRETKELKLVTTLVSDGEVTDMAEAEALFASVQPEGCYVGQALIDAIVNASNQQARRNASPAPEGDDTPDELDPIVEILINGGYFGDEAETAKNRATAWKRLCTQTANSFEIERQDAASKTKEYRAAKVAGLL